MYYLPHPSITDFLGSLLPVSAGLAKEAIAKERLPRRSAAPRWSPAGARRPGVGVLSTGPALAQGEATTMSIFLDAATPTRASRIWWGHRSRDELELRHLRFEDN